MAEYYRYATFKKEHDQIMKERRIETFTGKGTWYSPTHYDDPLLAEQELALPNGAPKWRIGPIMDVQLPTHTHIVPQRNVAPYKGRSGGGLEIRVNIPVYLFGLFDFSRGTWDI